MLGRPNNFATASWNFFFTQPPGEGITPTPNYSVQVTAPVPNFKIAGDTITAAIVGFGGAYFWSTGVMDLQVALSLTDTNNWIGSADTSQGIDFDFSTSNSVTSDTSGMNATGSALNVTGPGDMTIFKFDRN